MAIINERFSMLGRRQRKRAMPFQERSLKSSRVVVRRKRQKGDAVKRLRDRAFRRLALEVVHLLALADLRVPEVVRLARALGWEGRGGKITAAEYTILVSAFFERL